MNKSKRSAYIHIGLPKTGTTAIQSTLQRFFKEGKLDRFDMQFHNVDMIAPIWDFWCTGDKEYFIEQLHNKILEFSQLGEKNLIISQEDITTIFHSGDWGFRYDLLPVLATALKDYDVKIIIYIRRQDLFIESRINQHVKTGCSPTYNSANLYYKELIDECSKWGKGVIVRKYERESLYGNDAVTDFLHIVGLDELANDYIKHRGKTINSSLSTPSFRISMADNEQYKLSEAETRLKIGEIENQYKSGHISRESYVKSKFCILRGYDDSALPESSLSTRIELLTISAKGSSPSFFSPEQRAAILAQYAEDNAAVAREYFGEEGGKLFNDKIPKEVVDTNSEPSVAEVIQCFMPILIELTHRCEKLEHRERVRARASEKSPLSRFAKRIRDGIRKRVRKSKSK